MFQHIHSHEVNADDKAFTGIFIDGLGTVRACSDCGVLVVGGVTRCNRCVDRKYHPWWYKLLLKCVRHKGQLRLMDWNLNRVSKKGG